MREIVETVLGPVASGELGRVLMHEHIFVLDADVQQNYPGEWGDEDERVADAVRRLRELPKNGISTIVDVTVIGQGRNVARIKRIASQVPELNIVVATGIYTFDELPFFFSGGGRPEAMTEFFVRDITEGIADTGVKAGMLKCAVDRTGPDRRGRAGAARGLPGPRRHRRHADHHPHPRGRRSTARPSSRYSREEDVDLNRVVLGHSGDAVRDADYIAAHGRQRTHPGHGPLRHRPAPPPSATAATWWPSYAPAATPTGWSSPTTPAATSTGSAPAPATT